MSPDVRELRDLRDLLELASDDVPDLDLAPAAWDEARQHHRTVVRRTALGVGGFVAVGAAGWFVTDRNAGPSPVPSPSATPTATVATDGRMPSAEVEGVTVFMAPDPPAESLLPRYPDTATLQLPRHLGPADPRLRGQLRRKAGVAEPLRAVFLVVADGGGYHPVLYAPRAPAQVEVPGVRIEQWAGVQSALGPRSISDDRHRVVFPQVGRVVVLDARDGSVVDVEVPDPTLVLAGWARDHTTVVARGRDSGWLIDPATRRVQRTTQPVAPDWADLASNDDGGTLLRTFTGRGELSGFAPLLGAPVVPSTTSVSNTEGWVVGGVFLPGGYQLVLGRSQGLAAVQSDLPPTPRVLAATAGPLVPKGGYRALGWAPNDVILFESRSERAGFQGLVRRVLAWDVNEGRLYQVSEVDRAASGVGDFSGTYAI